MQTALIWTNVYARSSERFHGMTGNESGGLRAGHFGLAIAVALCVAACAGGNSDTSPTVNPLSVSGSSSGQPPPANSSAVLAWTPVTADTAGNTLMNLAGYEVHYGTSESALTLLILVNDPQQTTYTVPGLAPGTWYFSVNAYTSDGVEGLPSNTASKVIY
jgi:hypothetical protein